MLKFFALLACVLITAAQAAAPVITAPGLTTVVQASAKTIAGLSIAEIGAAPTLSYTVTLKTGNALLTATGAAVSGSGTASLTIAGTAPVVNAALATLSVTASGSDRIAITLVDANSQAAAPVQIGIAVLPSANTYLTYANQELALARSQSQCATLQCDGVQTVYWWNVIGPTNAGSISGNSIAAGSYAVEIQSSGPFATTTNSVTTVTACAVGCGLSTVEQGALVTAAQLVTVMP